MTFSTAYSAICTICILTCLAVIGAREPGSALVTGLVIVGLLWGCPNKKGNWNAHHDSRQRTACDVDENRACEAVGRS